MVFVFVYCTETLGSRKLKLSLLVLIYGALKRLFLLFQVIWCYYSNRFVKEYSRFSEVIVSYLSF